METEGTKITDKRADIPEEERKIMGIEKIETIVSKIINLNLTINA